MPRPQRIAVQCTSCGATLMRKPSEVRDNINHFCNKACYARHKTIMFSGENNPRWNGGTDVTCHWCGKTFKRELNHSRREQRHFCCMECKSAWQKTQTGQAAPAYKGTMVQVQCSQCSKEIARDPAKIERNDHFFCSGDCWNQWRSVHLRDENNPNFSTPAIETTCALCGEPIRRKPWRFGTTKRVRHFCCSAHRAEWHKKHFVGENSPSWKGGAANYRGPNWHEQRRAARKRDGYCCQACGISQKENGKALDVHHIVPFHDFHYVPSENENYLQANSLDNLTSLCSACHQKIETGHLSLWRPKAEPVV